MDLFSRSLAELLDAVGRLTDEDFERPSGCAGWLVRDLVCHFVIDAQDVLITLVTPSSEAPTHDAVTYWKVSHEPADDPLSALIVRLAAAYGEPWMLKFHVDDVGQAALRAGQLASPSARGPGAESLARCREMLEQIAGSPFPASFPDTDVLLVGTGRRAPTEAERAELGELGIPFVLG